MNIELSQSSPRPPSRHGVAAWLACFAVAACLYFLTCQRGLGWQDSSLFQWRVLTGDYQGKLGLALAHPLYIAAGRGILWLTGEHMSMGLSFFSGLGIAVAVANVMCIVTLLTGRRWVGLLIAGILMVSHSIWWLATWVKAEAWAATGLTAELWLVICLVQRPRWQLVAGLALVSGLDLAVSNFALLPLPVYVGVVIWLVAKRKLPGWSIAAAAGAYILGASLYLAMIVRYAVAEGSLAQAVGSALWGNYQSNVLNVRKLSTHFKENMVLTGMNFVGVLLPLAILGWAKLKRRLGGPLTWVIVSITLVEAVFFLRYNVPDQFMFGLPTLVMMAVAAGVGLDTVCRISPRWRTAAVAACLASIAFCPIFYAAAPGLATRFRPGSIRKRVLPFRDEARYWLIPWKQNETSADRFAREAFRQAGPNGVILPDGASGRVLGVYGRLHKECAGVTVQVEGAPLPPYDQDPRAFRRAVGDRPLYVTLYDNNRGVQAMARDARLDQMPGDVLYRVTWKASPATMSRPAP